MPAVVAGSPALLWAGLCVLCCAAGLAALLSQGKKLKLSKLHIILLVAMALWDAGGMPRTVVICMCSRKGAMKGDAVVWEPISQKSVPRNGLLWKNFPLGLMLPPPQHFLHAGAVCCSSSLDLYQQSGPEKTHGIRLRETSLGLSFSKCLKNIKKGRGRVAKTHPGLKSSAYMFWFVKRWQRKGVGECEWSFTKPAPTCIFHTIVYQSFMSIWSWPQNLFNWGIFFLFFFFIYLSEFDYKQNLL